MIACARALHDVEVVIREQDLCWAGGVLFVNFHKCVDAAPIIRLGEIPVKVVLPKDARITFMREDDRVRQQLVVDNRTVADHVVIFDESHGGLGPIPH